MPEALQEYLRFSNQFRGIEVEDGKDQSGEPGSQAQGNVTVGADSPYGSRFVLRDRNAPFEGSVARLPESDYGILTQCDQELIVTGEEQAPDAAGMVEQTALAGLACRTPQQHGVFIRLIAPHRPEVGLPGAA